MGTDRLRKAVKRAAARAGLYRALVRVRDRLRPPGRGLDLAEVRRSGTVPLPTTFTFEPTLRCNLHCTMCFQNEYRDAGGGPELALADVDRLLGALGPRFRRAYLVGGEVFMRADFEEVLALFEARGIAVFMTSNGTVLPRARLAALARFRHLVGIWFSLDGIGDVHDAVRGRGTFELTRRSVQAARGRFEVGVSFVILADNVHQMLDHARLMASLGVVEVNFQHEIYATAEERETSRRWLGWRDDELMVSTRPAGMPDTLLPTLRSNLEALPSLERELGVVTSFEPPVASARLDEFYAGTLRARAQLHCREIDNLRIDTRGNVIFCPYLRRSFGNLLEQPVEEIWNSPALRRFRVDLLEANLLPICQRCCKLGLRPEDSVPAPATGLPTTAVT